MISSGCLIDSIVMDAPALVTLRRDLHAHPELAYQEQRTADLVAAQLKAWSIPVERGLGTTGLVGIVKSGRGSRAIGLRADMDALPMTERNNFAHASIHPGRMHACGHDGHTAMLLAAAKCFATRRHFDGTVYLIFQPAEEGGGGAREMIKDGLLERFPMQAIFGVHNWPGLPAGQFAIKSGGVFASSNQFDITIRGKGTHAAMPQGGIDPLPIACQVVEAFQTIVTRNKRPIDAAVVSVTAIQAGEAINAIPQTCVLRGTVRTFADSVLDMVEARMREIAAGLCAAFGATCEFRFQRKYPPTVNHPRETNFVRGALERWIGAHNVQEFEPTMAAEDFSFYLRELPGCYFLIGHGDGEHRDGGDASGCTLHSPEYDFNDDLIALGGSIWVRLAEAWFAEGG